MKNEKILLYIIIPGLIILLFGGILAERYLQFRDFADPSLSEGYEDAKLTGTMNINTATAEQLESLPGIGPVIAQRIIDYREENGPYESLYDLYAVKGIGPGIINKIIDLIRMEVPQ